MTSIAQPIAEAAVGDQWLIAHATPNGVDVLAYRYRKTPEQRTKGGATIAAGIALGACVWCGRVRRGEWSGLVGEPRPDVLARAWRFVEKVSVG